MMSAAILPFDFETNAVRIVMRDDGPWFVAADVCRVLEHGNPRQVISRLQDDEKGVHNVDTLGGKQELNVVSESGLYALIFTSRKVAAQRFRKWVTSEVLPAIRRDGSYSIGAEDHADLAIKRARYGTLPEAHQDKAIAKVEALRQIEDLIARGSKVTHAIREVAEGTGLSERSLFSYRRMVYMTACSDWAPALAPRWSTPRGMQVACDPEAQRFFLSLVASGGRISDCYQRLLEVAAENGWGPIPEIWTMRRFASRALSNPVQNKKETA